MMSCWNENADERPHFSEIEQTPEQAIALLAARLHGISLMSSIQRMSPLTNKSNIHVKQVLSKYYIYVRS